MVVLFPRPKAVERRENVNQTVENISIVQNKNMFILFSVFMCTTSDINFISLEVNKENVHKEHMQIVVFA